MQHELKKLKYHFEFQILLLLILTIIFNIHKIISYIMIQHDQYRKIFICVDKMQKDFQLELSIRNHNMMTLFIIDHLKIINKYIQRLAH